MATQQNQPQGSAVINRFNFVATYHHDTYSALDITQPQFSCKGRAVFATGAGSGIGKATALAFAQAGASAVIIAGRTESSLVATKEQIQAQCKDTRVEHFVLDVSDADAVTKTFKDIASQGIGPIDILVNCAGSISYMETVQKANFESLWTQFDVNVKGSMLVVREFASQAPRGATLVNVSSGAAVIDFVPGLAGYSASKLATLKLMDYLHHELGSEQDLRVFNIQPGVVATKMAKEGKSICPDTAELPAHFSVWLSTKQADFLRGRFVYANWDINELIEKKEEIQEKNLMTLAFRGWDSSAF